MIQATSLRWKLTGLMAAGSLVTAAVAAAGFSSWDLNRFWQNTSAQTAALADIISDQVGAAVILDDSKAAKELLGSLRSDRSIRDAVLYGGKMWCFAEYHRDGRPRSCPPKPSDGFERHTGWLRITRQVMVDKERVGTLVLTADLPSIAAILGQYASGAALIILLSLAVAGVLAIVMQSRVSKPILAIAKVAQGIAETHHFAERVEELSTDEVGVLANSFNLMLDEIERRDAELALHGTQLELEVAERSRVNQELRVAKEKAEDVARIKSEFLANMSHEIRTPLNGVTGMIGLALDHCEDAEEREQLVVARQAALSLTVILNDILDFSKIEAGKLAIEAVEFDVCAVVRDCLKIFEVPVREKHLRLDWTNRLEGATWVQGDPVRLRQIVINLTGNAVKFTLEGGVHVTLERREDGMLRFEIADTGIGIPPDKLQSIFEAFTQADGSHTRRFGGSGLGLAITRRLVDLMGGKLHVESETGSGSRFYVELPFRAVARPAGLISLGPASENAAPLKLPKLNVLVAEDNVVNQKVVSGILRRQGWTFEVVGNGREAYERFLAKKFDLLLMDVQMPDVDGLEATALIRAHERLRSLTRTPIIALTAHASKSQHDECIAQGMDAVVTKPVDVKALMKAAEILVRGAPVVLRT